MKYIKVFFLILIFFFFNFNTIQAIEKINIDFFYSTTCPHCAKAKIFLDQVKKNYSEVKINNYEISANTNKLFNYYQKYKVEKTLQGVVPAIFISDKYYIGYNEEIGKEINNNITSLIKGIKIKDKDKSSLINLPFVGKINPNNFALPVLAIILGAMDGFNVCSLGALILILALVLSLRSRVKTLLFGGGFIFTTAMVYGVLIIFWYQLFNFLSLYLRKMEIIIGLITLFGAGYFFKDFLKFKKQGLTCGIGPTQKIEGKFTEKFKKMITENKTVLPILFSIFVFAVVITVVEFPCSAAVPVVFAGMLSKAELSTFSYLFYIALYVIFYMLDELTVFLIAFFTMKLWMSSPKFIIWITLAESIILFLLGGYYIFGAI